MHSRQFYILNLSALTCSAHPASRAARPCLRRESLRGTGSFCGHPPTLAMRLSIWFSPTCSVEGYCLACVWRGRGAGSRRSPRPLLPWPVSESHHYSTVPISSSDCTERGPQIYDSCMLVNPVVRHRSSSLFARTFVLRNTSLADLHVTDGTN